MDIFSFNSYKKYLNSLVSSPDAPSGARSKLARACGCHLSYLSRVLAGKGHLTTDQGLSLCAHYGFSDRETEYFLLLLEYEKVASVESRKFFKIKIEQHQRSQEDFSSRYDAAALSQTADETLYYSAWYWSAIHVLACCDGVHSVADIASRLSLQKDLVSFCLGKLEEMSLLQKIEGGWKNASRFRHLPKGSPLNAMNHSNWRQKAILDSQVNSTESIHYSSVQSLSRQDFERFRALVFSFIDSARDLVKSSGKDEIYCLNCDLFSIR
ncbi:MAG: DUF4423 domain-containing protein [Proteobacteria bacterium]|nr:DUF4423 domain-containing protein [Pseudomonadota bacterium]